MEPIKNLVVFGATGDLVSRLLLPGLASLLASDPTRRVALVGADAKPAGDWDALVRKAFATAPRSTEATEYTLANSRFVHADATSTADLHTLLSQLPGPSCLYFALPPRITLKSLQALRHVPLPDSLALALEKPIGSDVHSARELNELVGQLVPASQVFRVDHFLNNPAVHSFAGLRFANRMLEPLLSQEHVQSIEITYDETLGLEGRAGFYDHSGALRDMIQSHLLQVMGLTMMEPPARFDAVELPALTAHVLRCTRLWPHETAAHVLRGRYTAGQSGQETLPNYVDEPGVDPARNTETFAQITVEVDNWRWAGVPVTLRSGKAIGAPRKEIAIKFRTPVHRYPQFPHDGHVPANVLRMHLDTGALEFEMNVGGPFDLRGMQRVTAESGTSVSALTSYGNVMRGLLDADATFSVRADGSEEGWRIIAEVQELVDSGLAPLHDYRAGSPGPLASGA